jgi:murein DD-endopeptidase MepM/ murein hydrolase activator NlpD
MSSVRRIPPLLLALPPLLAVARPAEADGGDAGASALVVLEPGAGGVYVQSAATYQFDGLSAFHLAASSSVGREHASARASVASALLLAGRLRITGAWAHVEAPGSASASPGSITYLGHHLEAPPGVRVALGESAYLVTQPAVAGATAGLLVHLLRPADGLPAGTDIVFARARASAPAPAAGARPHRHPKKRHAPANDEPTKPDPGRGSGAPAHARREETAATPRAARSDGRGALLGRAPSHARRQPPPSPPAAVIGAQPALSAGPYRFPVVGSVEFTDTFGAWRRDTGWHHGDDIFAPVGRPVVAVCDGVVSRVGWNRVGGWRLWLRDGDGNRFYYAHLSGYAASLRSGAHVRAGELLGYVGHTGDANGTPPHLHFEVHPVEFRALGYDGAVDPTPYLDSWPRIAQPVQSAQRTRVGHAATAPAGAEREHEQPQPRSGPAPTGRVPLLARDRAADTVTGGSDETWPLAAALLLLASPLCVPLARRGAAARFWPQTPSDAIAVGARVLLPDGGIAVVLGGARAGAVYASRLAGRRPGRPFFVRADLLRPALEPA